MQEGEAREMQEVEARKMQEVEARDDGREREERGERMGARAHGLGTPSVVCSSMGAPAILPMRASSQERARVTEGRPTSGNRGPLHLG